MIQLKRRPTAGAEKSPEADTDRELNAAVFATFDNPQGQKVLSYLYNISIASISGAAISANELFYKEGMRLMAADLHDRFNKGNRFNKGKRLT
jgi:hypothetical protein